MDGDNTLRLVIGAILGVGCGAAILVGCIATGIFLASSAPASGPASPPIAAPMPPMPPMPPVVPPAPPPVAPPGVGTPPPDMEPRLVRATVTEVSGAAGVTVGALCEFNVERRDDDESGGFVCNAQVVCGGRLLYGGSSAGFFPCTLYDGPPRDVVGADEATTATDGDAAMQLDTRAGTLTIWDDASGASGELAVSAHVDSVT